MQKGHVLELSCQSCQNPVTFSVFDLDKNEGKIICNQCSLVYDFSDETLNRQIKKFEALCHQIQVSEEILSDSAIGVTIGDREVKIPFKLLLTRLNSTLDLIIDKKPLTVRFRIEPIRDYLKNF